MKYTSIKELCDAATKRGIKISELCLEDQAEEMQLPKEYSIAAQLRLF